MKGIIGNSYASDAGKILQEINPLNYLEKPKNQRNRMTKEMALAMIGQK